MHSALASKTAAARAAQPSPWLACLLSHFLLSIPSDDCKFKSPPSRMHFRSACTHASGGPNLSVAGGGVEVLKNKSNKGKKMPASQGILCTRTFPAPFPIVSCGIGSGKICTLFLFCFLTSSLKTHQNAAVFLLFYLFFILSLPYCLLIRCRIWRHLQQVSSLYN